MKLLISGLVKFLCGILLVGLLIFLPAGSLAFTNGWLFIGVLFVPVFILGVILFIKAPHLLEKRLNSKEKEATQKGVVALSALIFMGGFVVAGLDFRFGWSKMPLAVIIIATLIFLISYLLYAEVMRENAYLSRTVEVQENQKVVDRGLYSVVRHPMYAVTVLLFLAIPLILGSWWAFLIFLPYPVVIGVRITNEEKVLSEQLEGYEEYKKKVKYRLVPFLW